MPINTRHVRNPATLARPLQPPRATPRPPLPSRVFPPRPAADVEAQSRALETHAQELASSAKHASMRATRAALPAPRHRNDVLAALGASRVCVVTGGTGCGKSTQVRGVMGVGGLWGVRWVMVCKG